MYLGDSLLAFAFTEQIEFQIIQCYKPAQQILSDLSLCHQYQNYLIEYINFIQKQMQPSSNLQPLVFQEMLLGRAGLKKPIQQSYRKYKTLQKNKNSSKIAINHSSQPDDAQYNLSPHKNSAKLINFQFDNQFFPPTSQKSMPHRHNRKINIGITFANNAASKSEKQSKERYAENCRQISKKAKGARIITRFKYPIEQNNIVKKYMCIEKIKLPAPERRLKNSVTKLTLIDNSCSEDCQPASGKYSEKSKKYYLQKIKQSKTSKSHRRNNSLAFTRKNMQQQLELQDGDFRQKFISQFPIRKPMLRKDYFVFGMGDRVSQQNKMEYFRDYLWKINYSNGLHVNTPEQVSSPYKVYIGPGNNYYLLKGMMKKRFWWSVVDKPEDSTMSSINFVWTQLKQNVYYSNQDNNTYQPYVPEQNILTSSNNQQEESLYNDDNRKIFGAVDYSNWGKYLDKNWKAEQKINQKTYLKRLQLYKHKPMKNIKDSETLKIHNHLQNNFYIGNKKALFYNMRKYYQLKGLDPFTVLPLTFHITKGVDDPEFTLFKAQFDSIQKQKNKTNLKNVWIAKPGQNSNRGNGITVCYGIDDILIRLRGRQRNSDGKLRTFILQKYIEKPLLYQKRKFDIRHYMLVTCVNGLFKSYWYEEGYLRTSSYQYNIKCSKDPFIHLTNDAVQKNNQNYGKYEKGNKLSYQDFQKYLQSTIKSKKVNFFEHILPAMKSMAVDAIRSTYRALDRNRKSHNFQLLGLDFMIDEDLKPWLIQVNTNPCLQICSSLLDKIIPQLIDNVLKICIDPLFPPPQNWQTNKKVYFGQNPIGQNKFELVFDETVEGRQISLLYQGETNLDENMGKIEEDTQIFENDGDQNWQSSKK